MKIAFYFHVLLCCTLFLAAGCIKDQDVPEVTIDIKAPDPVITTLSNGKKQLDFTIEVTQTGDFFYQDFDFQFSRTDSLLVVDSFHGLLPSAHEFVHRSVVVPSPGVYKLAIFIGPADNGAGSSSTVVVPN